MTNHCMLGPNISDNRERLVRRFLADPDKTHILWIDDDMVFKPDALYYMARRRHPIVGCNYAMKGKRRGFTAMKKDMSGRIYTGKNSTGLEEALFMGFGFCLIERQVFEKMTPPRFPIQYIAETEEYTTEDTPFFVMAADLGYKVWVDQDASKHVTHLGDYGYTWEDIQEGEESGVIATS